jgi:hypothetical protein
VKTDIASVREHIEKIAGVSRTWFEWSLENSTWSKTLVVEVEFDTDPNTSGLQNVLNAIGNLALTVQTTMTLSRLKVVPIPAGALFRA